MRIKIETIPHIEQRYQTVGDYTYNGNNINIFVSKMKSCDYEFLVALHELIESKLCKNRGVALKDIDAFDIRFEWDRENGLHSSTEEPGDDPKAPYHKEHVFATKIEKMVAKELGVDWDKYSERVENL